MSEASAPDGIAQALGHAFRDEQLLNAALTHRSWTNEHGPGGVDYERLEFLGDAVVELLLTEALYRLHPHLDEGGMTRMRAALVNETALADMARRIGLREYVRVGKGEELSGGRDKDSILSDSLEAVCGALFLDAGFERSREIILGWFAPLIEMVGADADYKSQLQAYVQALGEPTPHYRTVDEIGPDHDKTFEVALFIGRERISAGRGRSKKDASQEAAKAALEMPRFQDP